MLYLFVLIPFSFFYLKFRESWGFFVFWFCFFERERERERAQGNEGQRERIPLRFYTINVEPEAGLELTPCGVRTHEPGDHDLSQLNHPGTLRARTLESMNMNLNLGPNFVHM